MPAFEYMDLLQRALLWRQTGVNYYAEVLVGTPEEIFLRIDDSTSEMLDAQGNKVSLDATVVLGPGCDVKIGDLMWFAPDSTYSALEQWNGTGSGAADGDSSGNLLQVKMFDSTSDLKNRVIRRLAGLLRFRSGPPGSTP